MEQPDFYRDYSTAPAGMAIYSERLRPAWRGPFFIGSLKFDDISRLDPQGGFREVERPAFPETGRVRDGTLWFLSEAKEAVCRTRPGGNVHPPPIQPAWPA